MTNWRRERSFDDPSQERSAIQLIRRFPSNVYHRRGCYKLLGLQVTTFKLSQIGKWALPCEFCQPPPVER